MLQTRATTLCGFSFSRFVTAAANQFGRDYRPRSPEAAGAFPLSIEEACALANDVELEMATGDATLAAALITAHAPFAQPGIGKPDWLSYTTMLDRLGIGILDGDPA